MAHLTEKRGTFHVRFRWGGRHYRRTLRTKTRPEAEAQFYTIKATISRLALGHLVIPAEVDPGDFIVSGGLLTAPLRAVPADDVPTLRSLIEEFKTTRYTVAPSTLSTEKTHLSHLSNSLTAKLDKPCNQVIQRDLDRHLFERSQAVVADTVSKERATIGQLFRWAVEQGYLASSPAAKLARIKGAAERPPFRTMAEIQTIMDRGGLGEDEALDLWECLYLAPAEIACLLDLVRDRANMDFGSLLHAIPAYTGMRRGEVMRLKWQDVDFDRDFIIARSRKQSRQSREVARQIDLHPELRAILLEWRARRPKGQLVVCRHEDLKQLDSNTANRYFYQPLLGTHWCLSRRKRYFKIGFHTYRHSFASNLAAASVDQRLIDEFMGHQTEAMRKRYRHLFPHKRREAIEAFSLRVAQAQPAQELNV